MAQSGDGFLCLSIVTAGAVTAFSQAVFRTGGGDRFVGDQVMAQSGDGFLCLSIVTAGAVTAFSQAVFRTGGGDGFVGDQVMAQSRDMSGKAYIVSLVGVGQLACLGAGGSLGFLPGIFIFGKGGHFYGFRSAAIGAGAGQKSLALLGGSGGHGVGVVMIADRVQGGQPLGHKISRCFHQLQIHAKRCICGGLACVGDLQGGQGNGSFAGVGQDDDIAYRAALLSNICLGQIIVQVCVGASGEGAGIQCASLWVHSGNLQSSGCGKGLDTDMNGGDVLSVALNGKGHCLTAFQIDLVVGAEAFIVRDAVVAVAVADTVNEADAVDIGCGVTAFVPAQDFLTQLNVLGPALIVLHIIFLVQALCGAVDADGIHIEVIAAGAEMVEEGDVGGSHDYGIGAVIQRRALDDGDLIQIVISVRGLPVVILLVLDVHISVGGIGGKLGGFVVAPLCHSLLYRAPAFFCSVIGPGVLDPREFVVDAALIAVVGIHDPAPEDSVGLGAFIDPAGDEARLVARQTDEVKACAGKDKGSGRPGTVFRIGAAGYRDLLGRAEGIGGAGVICRIVAVDVIRVIGGELKVPRTVLPLMIRLSFSHGFPIAREGDKIIFIVDGGGRNYGNGIVEIEDGISVCVLDRIGKYFRIRHAHVGGGVSHGVAAVGSRAKQTGVAFTKAAEQAVGGGHAFGNRTDSHKGTLGAKAVIDQNMNVNGQTEIHHNGVGNRTRRSPVGQGDGARGNAIIVAVANAVGISIGFYHIVGVAVAGIAVYGRNGKICKIDRPAVGLVQRQRGVDGLGDGRLGAFIAAFLSALRTAAGAFAGNGGFIGEGGKFAAADIGFHDENCDGDIFRDVFYGNASCQAEQGRRRRLCGIQSIGKGVSHRGAACGADGDHRLGVEAPHLQAAGIRQGQSQGLSVLHAAHGEGGGGACAAKAGDLIYAGALAVNEEADRMGFARGTGASAGRNFAGGHFKAGEQAGTPYAREQNLDIDILRNIADGDTAGEGDVIVVGFFIVGGGQRVSDICRGVGAYGDHGAGFADLQARGVDYGKHRRRACGHSDGIAVGIIGGFFRVAFLVIMVEAEGDGVLFSGFRIGFRLRIGGTRGGGGVHLNELGGDFRQAGGADNGSPVRIYPLLFHGQTRNGLTVVDGNSAFILGHIAAGAFLGTRIYLIGGGVAHAACRGDGLLNLINVAVAVFIFLGQIGEGAAPGTAAEALGIHNYRFACQIAVSVGGVADQGVCGGFVGIFNALTCFVIPQGVDMDIHGFCGACFRLTVVNGNGAAIFGHICAVGFFRILIDLIGGGVAHAAFRGDGLGYPIGIGVAVCVRHGKIGESAAPGTAAKALRFHHCRRAGDHITVFVQRITVQGDGGGFR